MAGPECHQVLPLSALEAHLKDEFQAVLNFPAALGSGRLTEAGVGGKARDYAVSGQKTCAPRTARSIATRHLSTRHEISVDLITAEVWRIEEVKCFQTELDAQLLSHTPVFVNSEISIHVLWTMTVSTRRIAQGSNLESGQGKRRRTKDLIVMSSACATRAGNHIWTIVAIESSTGKAIECPPFGDVFAVCVLSNHQIGRWI